MKYKLFMYLLGTLIGLAIGFGLEYMMWSSKYG